MDRLTEFLTENNRSEILEIRSKRWEIRSTIYLWMLRSFKWYRQSWRLYFDFLLSLIDLRYQRSNRSFVIMANRHHSSDSERLRGFALLLTDEQMDGHSWFWVVFTTENHKMYLYYYYYYYYYYISNSQWYNKTTIVLFTGDNNN